MPVLLMNEEWQMNREKEMKYEKLYFGKTKKKCFIEKMDLESNESNSALFPFRK